MFKVLYALRARAAYVASGLMYHWQAEVKT